MPGAPVHAGRATSYYLRPGYDFGDEFDFGLSLILDSLTARLEGGS